MSLIDMRSVKKSYRLGPVDVEILRGVDLRIEPGELVSIVGTSGCGKSTLMNLMGFLDTPSSGSYRFENRDASSLSDRELSAIRNRKIGFVFQQFHLLPRLTALQNVCLPLAYRGVSRGERARTAERMLAEVGMAERMHHRPGELSGGQQQRVAIARALSGGPSLILADEPTGALDTRVGSEIMELFMRLNGEQAITIVIITHDPGIAARCPRQVRMRDGVIEETARGRP